MRIFDCFLFFNELELLDLRLMTLNDVVDYFVLVEANKTFTDHKKDFIFEKNKTLYKKYLDKIIYVKVTDTPVLDKTKNVWAIEEFQRNCITRGLGGAKGEDRIMISDVDEIPDPDRIKQLRESKRPITFNQHLFYYYVNCLNKRRFWNGTIMTPFGNMRIPQELRQLSKKGYNRVRNCGWHYSYMGGLKKIKQKLDNLSDAHFRKEKVGSDEDIVRKINSQKDLWDESRVYRLIDVRREGAAPKTIEEFIAKYPSFHFGKL